MTVTRTAAFALVLMTGTAFAGPAPAERDNALQRFGKSMKASAAYFKADLKTRNEKAGPGIFKRTMSSLHAGVERTAANLHNGFESAKDKTAALGEKIAIKVSEKRDAVSASLSAKRDAVHASFERMGDKLAAFRARTADRVDTGVAKTEAFGKRIVTSTKAGIAATRSSMAQSHAARVAYKSADKDFNAWLNEKGNEDAKTFYRGASKDAGMLSTKIGKGFNTAAVVLNTAVGVTASPANLALVPISIAARNSMTNQLATEKRAVAERTINMFMDKVPAERLEAWSKASYIDPELAK